MLLWKLAVASVLLSCGGATQDLPPDLLLLTRIKSHMREELSNVPNYTCLETIARFHKEPPGTLVAQKGLQPLDTVGLEIVYSNGREWYGSPGDRNLSVENPGAFVGSGMIGNGAFGLMLDNIIKIASFRYRGEEALDGRTAVRYDFQVPALMKPLEISIPGARGTVGEAGSFWADPQSLDLIRLEERADEIPPYLPLDEESAIVNYARMQIGSYNVLMAQQADLHMLIASGMEDFDRLEFTHCRAYSSQSVVLFDTDSKEPPKAWQAAPSAPIPRAPGSAVPALLKVTLELTTAISDKYAVGALIDGKVSGDVARKGKILIPGGSVVHGRIRRLEFTEVDVRAGPLMFYADLLGIDKNPRIKLARSERVFVRGANGFHDRDEAVTLPELPGVASFFVSGKTFTIPPNFRTVWRTRGPIRGD